MAPISNSCEVGCCDWCTCYGSRDATCKAMAIKKGFLPGTRNIQEFYYGISIGWCFSNLYHAKKSPNLHPFEETGFFGFSGTRYCDDQLKEQGLPLKNHWPDGFLFASKLASKQGSTWYVSVFSRGGGGYFKRSFLHWAFNDRFSDV